MLRKCKHVLQRYFQHLLISLLTAFAGSHVLAKDCELLVLDEVLQAENLRLSSQIKNDFDVMSDLLDDDLVYVRNSAVADNKVSYLDSMRRGQTVYKSIEHTNDSIRIFECVAILSGQGRYDVQIAGRPLKLLLRYHGIWQKKQNKLKFVSWQATRVPD